MKIATFNINGIRSRLSKLLEWLMRERPDVVCLQELKAPAEMFPAKALVEIGYHAIWHGQRA
jgi:exodeoxyribonuclease-3